MRLSLLPFFCGALLALPAVARAQAVPDHPIDPDRPDLTNTSHLVDPGFVQFEAGGIYTRDSVDRRRAGAPLGIRIGVRDWIEARVGFDNLWLRATDAGTAESGLGNLQVGAKIRVWPEADGQSRWSLLPSITVPTASEEKGFTSGGVDATLAVLTAVELSARASLGLNYIAGAIAGGDAGPHFAQHVASASLGVSATDHWNPYFEMFVISRDRPGGPAIVAINTGTLFVISPRLALDGGVQFGLTEEASSFSAFGGFSVAVREWRTGKGAGARRITPRAVTSASAFRDRD